MALQPVKTRSVTLLSGHRFEVPQNIQRIDSKSTHGWQVRYGGTKFFSDGSSDGSGAEASLKLATKELLRRVATLPAPVKLKEATPLSNKGSTLPPGISGPIVKSRRGEPFRSAVLSVVLPRFGSTPRIRSVYIGTENTYTKQRFREALAKAIELRTEAVERYRTDATKARRQEAKAMAATLTRAR